MDWALHQQQVRFDIRAERAEYEYLFKHSARVLQDRLARLGGGDRTKEIPVAEWERVYRKEAQERRPLHQARVLGGEERKGITTLTKGGTSSESEARLRLQIGSKPPYCCQSRNYGLCASISSCLRLSPRSQP